MSVQPSSNKPSHIGVAETLGRVAGNFRKGYLKRVAEIIGTWTFVKPMLEQRILLNKDTTYPAYDFWDNLRRGKAPGYEIGGLFCAPIAQTIASYAYGPGIQVSLIETAATDADTKSVHEDGKPTKALKTAALVKPAKPTATTGSRVDYTNAEMKRFIDRIQGLLVNITIDSYCLAEQYIFINPDTTVSVASPETVNVTYSASDYRKIEKVTVTTKYVQSVVQDIYTDDLRTVKVHYYDARPDVENTYENIIGRIPMVHFATDRGPNETHGRPIYEAALPVMQRYDNLVFNTCNGVDMMGNPIPAFTGLDNPAESLALNSTQQTYTDEQGNTQTRNLLRFDRNLGLVLGKGGKVELIAPPVGFTKDSLDTLRQLFLLLLNHARIPEFLWGGAIASSKASTESQLDPFIRYIDYRRMQLEGIGGDTMLGLDARGGILELLDIWLRTYQLLNPSIVVGPCRVTWPVIDVEDSQTKYMWGAYLGSTAKITDEDLLKVANLKVLGDPAAAVARAQGKPQRFPQYDDYDANLKQARLDAAKAATFPADDNGPGYDSDYPYPVLAGKNDNMPNRWSLVGPMAWQNEVSPNS